jgi:hypothetical protein
MNNDTNKPELVRSNCKVISSTVEPVYTASISVNNPVMPSVIESRAAAYAYLGQRFTVDTSALSMANNGYLVLQITIPANWGKTMYVDRMRVGTSITSIVDCLPATITGTTPLTVINSNFGSNKTSTVTAGYLLTTTNPITGTPVQTCILSGGTYELDYDGRFIMQSKATAQNYCIKVTNTGTASSTGMVSFSWWEV